MYVFRKHKVLWVTRDNVFKFLSFKIQFQYKLYFLYIYISIVDDHKKPCFINYYSFKTHSNEENTK